MDTRKLDTGQVIAAGILDKEMPSAPWPEKHEQLAVHLSYQDDAEWIGNGVLDDRAEVAQAVERGAVVHCAEYYGIPYVWKTDDGYRGVLLQYRSTTEDKSFATADEAVEWFCDTAEAVAG